MKKNHHHADQDDAKAKSETAEDVQLVDVGAAPEQEPVMEAEAIPVDQMENLRKELAEMNDKYLRLNADFENFRKRSYKEMTGARLAAVADTLQPFLRVLDIFNMAVASVDASPNIDAIKQGMQMILTEYGRAMEELGVMKCDAVGQQFDPMQHEAMAKEPSDQPEGTIVKQWSCGYKLGDRLLRPARVVVSSGTTGK